MTGPRTLNGTESVVMEAITLGDRVELAKWAPTSIGEALGDS